MAMLDFFTHIASSMLIIFVLKFDESSEWPEI